MRMSTQKVETHPDALERQHMRQRRRSRGKTIGAFTVVAAIGLASVASSVVGALGRQSARTPADKTRTVAPGPSPGAPQAGAVIDHPVIDLDPFVDRINSCRRLLVTRQQVESALGFRAEDPVPWKPRASQRAAYRAAQVETWGGVLFGCEYASRNNFASAPNKEDGAGQLVISAYRPDSPPRQLGRSKRVHGLGDEAVFSPFGNRDEHVPGPERATSILEVRSGDYLVLRFNAGVFDTPHVIGADLAALRQLAEDALATLEESAPANGATLDTEAASKSCGDFRIAPPGRYPLLLVEVVEGNVPCRDARRAMKAHYHSRDTGSWGCHGPEGFAGCEKPSGETIRARFACRDWEANRARCLNTFGPP
jgi:hypothetical protein